MEYAFATDEMLELFEPVEFVSGSYDFSAENAIFERYREIGKRAREQGTLLGRIFYKPVADGKAHYMVIEVAPDEGFVQVAALPIWDGYEDRTIADLDDVLPIPVVQKWVDQQAAFDDMWSKAS